MCLFIGYEKSSLFENSDSKTCPIDPKNAIFVARTEYNVLMYDSKNNNQRWNITFFDYSSNNMGKEMTNNYGKKLIYTSSIIFKSPKLRL